MHVSPDGGLLVGGRPITLTGLQLRPTSDLDARLSTWLDRSGSRVQCQPQGNSYRCVTPYGADLGGALVVSGFATPNPDASAAYQSLASAWQTRTVVLGTSPSYALTSLLAGTANPSCQNIITCGARYIFIGYQRNNGAFERQDWRALVESILAINYQNDIDYYYLGRAAEAMGAYSVASIYYQKAGSLAQSSNPNDRCSSITNGNVCGGINILADLPGRIRADQGLAAFMF